MIGFMYHTPAYSWNIKTDKTTVQFLNVIPDKGHHVFET